MSSTLLLQLAADSTSLSQPCLEISASIRRLIVPVMPGDVQVVPLTDRELLLVVRRATRPTVIAVINGVQEAPRQLLVHLKKARGADKLALATDR